jgi:ribonuclease HI
MIEGDSQLVIRQVEGAYKVRSKNLISLHQTAIELLRKIPSTILRHIPRAVNRRADELSNIAMDLMISKTCNDDIYKAIKNESEWSK